MRQAAPPGPGKALQALLHEQGYTPTELAKRISVSRVHVSRVIHGHCRVSTDMAIRLSRFFGNPISFWLNLQCEVDLRKQNLTAPLDKLSK